NGGSEHCCSALRSALSDCERAHRKSAEAFDLHRHGEEFRTAYGQFAEPAHMLDDRDLASEQLRVNGALAGVGAIDVVRVDSHEPRAGTREPACEIAGEVRMILEIPVGVPVAVPARL